MPQKKNPDVAELVRGKAGRLVGILTGMFTTLKGIPFAYDLDLQEDKEAVFDVEDNLLPALRTFAGLIATLTVDPDRMLQLAASGDSAATDLADYLVARGVPFRRAHEAVGGVVRDCQARGIPLREVTLDRLRERSPLFAADVIERLDPVWSVNARTSPGGTAPSRVWAAIERAIQELDAAAALWNGRLPPHLRET